MENNQFPEQEEEILLPPESQDIPVTDAEEESAVIEELHFDPPAFSMDDDAEEGAFLIGEAPPVVALPLEEESPLVEEDILPAEPAVLPEPEAVLSDDTIRLPELELPQEPAPSFMDRIPDVEEDYPQEPAEAAPAEEDPALEIINDPLFFRVQPEKNSTLGTIYFLIALKFIDCILVNFQHHHALNSFFNLSLSQFHYFIPPKSRSISSL